MRYTTITLAILILVLQAGCSSAPRSAAVGQNRSADAKLTIDRFKRTDPSISESFFKNAIAWAVFPDIGKAGFGVGGAYGKGVLYENGEVVGYCDLAQGSYGFQFGGQVYSEIIFFEHQHALDEFKTGTFEFSAQASAVAASADASANANYEHGVAVFTLASKGLMYEAAIGGQKFDYTPKY
jgi:lipid-binding SYLF domain-containing protein